MKVIQLIAISYVVAAALVCRGDTPSLANSEVSIDKKYLTNREPAVSIEIPAVGSAVNGLTLGAGVTIEVGEATRIKASSASPTSVFTEQYRRNVTSTPSDQALGLVYSENYSMDDHTKQFALSIDVSGGGFWGSASAHYNQQKYENIFHNKLVREVRLISDAGTTPLRDASDIRDLSILKTNVIEMIKQARLALDQNPPDVDKLAQLRQDFFLTYGNAYVVKEHNGAQLVIQASQELSTHDTIEKQTADFSAATSGLSSALSKASASTSIKKVIKDSRKKSSINYTAFLQGAGGQLPPTNDADKIVEFINQGNAGKGWFKDAQDRPPRLTITASNYSTIPALAILTQPSGTISALNGTRELVKARIYPVMDGKENRDYSAVATFLQYPNGFGMLNYAWVPLPRPDGQLKVDREQGIISIPIKVTRFSDPQMLDLICSRWKEAKVNELGGDRSDNQIYFQSIDRPRMLDRATILYELEYPPNVTDVDRLKLSGGHGDTYDDYPPNIQSLYDRYPEFDHDTYVFEYRGSPAAVDRFKALVTTSGLHIRPVVDTAAQRIKLNNFELKTDAQYTIQTPKRIEPAETSDALRRLVNLEESKVSKDSLRRSGKIILDAKRCIETDITEIPGFSRIRMVAVGKIDFWKINTPRYYADFENGEHMQYYKAAINSGTQGGGVRLLFPFSMIHIS